jgi:hypothetical protein
VAAWNAVAYVGSGLSLIAFVVAALLHGYRSRLLARQSIINSAPQDKRVDAILATADTFKIDISGLSARQQTAVIIAEISRRSERDKWNAQIFVAFGILLSAVAIVSILISNHANLSDNQLPEKILPTKVPPGRLLSARPFRGRLDYCVDVKCDFDLILRGYDEQGNLRVNSEKHFSGIAQGSFFDTDLDSDDTLYFEANTNGEPVNLGNSVDFRLFCRFKGTLISSERINLAWTEFNEAAKGYAAWLVCNDSQFKASLGIGVNIANSRKNEPNVKDDPGRPK